MLLQIHWNIYPEIFRIGSFAFRYYTLFFVLVFAGSYWILSKVFRKEGVSMELLDKLTIYVFLGIILGARLGHCLFYEFDYYSSRPWEIILPFKIDNGNFEFTGFQGLASHGAAIGTLIAVGLYCRKYKVDMLWLLDRLMIVVALSGGLVRIGNLFNSEIIGRPTDIPWAFVFERVDMLPRHPTQLYEALSYFIIFYILWRVYQNHIHKVSYGFMFGLSLVLIFTVRFFVEFLKENQEAFESNMPINMGQLLSLPFIAAGIFFIIVKMKKMQTK